MNINVKVKYNRIYSLKNENQCPFTSPNNNIIVVTNRQSLNEWISELFLPYQTNLCYSCKYPTQRTEESLLCLKLKWKSYWTEKWFDNKKSSLHKLYWQLKTAKDLMCHIQLCHEGCVTLLNMITRTNAETTLCQKQLD